MDKLTKWGYFIAYTEEISAEDVARIYIKEVFARHGALIKIMSDRDLSNINSILPTNRWLNRETKLDVRTVLKVLY